MGMDEVHRRYFFSSELKIKITLKVSCNVWMISIPLYSLYMRNIKSLLSQSVLTVRSLKLICIVNPLNIINFLNLIQCILLTTKNRLSIAKDDVLKGCVPSHKQLKNILKAYALGKNNCLHQPYLCRSDQVTV